jgi:hypothetical protein
MMPLTPKAVCMAIGLLAAFLSVILDKRRIGLRKTIPQIRAEIAPATTIVRCLEAITLLSFVCYVFFSFV